MKPAVWVRRLPWLIVAVVVALMVLGCLGISRYEQLSGDSNSFARRQMFFLLPALFVMFAAAMPSYRVLCRFSYLLFLGSLALLVAVYFFPPINYSHRWIRIGSIGLQPSEFAKVAYVVALARYLMYRENYRRFRGLLAPLLLTLIPVLLILREPDLGTAVIFLPVLMVMLFAAGARRIDLAAVLMAGMFMLPVLWTQMSLEQKSRITALFEQPAAGERPSDDAYHLHQAKQVRALGGVWGSWFTGQPTDDLAVYRLPEGHSDFIFCILGERFGLPGMGLLLALYALLVWRALAVATATREPFGRLLAVGIAALIGIQVLINAGMTVGLLPITGLSMPFVSYGGSGLVANAVAVGLLLNVGLRPGYEVANEPFRYTVK